MHALLPSPTAPSVHPRSPGTLERMKLRLQRFSPFGGGGDGGGATIKPASADHSSIAEVPTPHAGHPHRMSPSQQADGGSSLLELAAATGGDGAAQTGGSGSAWGEDEGSSMHEGSSVEDDSEEEREQAAPAAEAAVQLASRGLRPHQAAAAAAVASTAAERAAQAQAASMVRRTSRQKPPGESGDGEQACAADARPHLGREAARQQQERVERDLGQQLSVDLESQEQPAQAARAAANAASSPHSRSSVFRRCCPWLLLRLPWQRRQQRQRVAQAVVRSQSFAET